MQERIITASVLEDAEKINEEIRGICAEVNQVLDILEDTEETFLETTTDKSYSYLRIRSYTRAHLESLLTVFLKKCIEERESISLNVSDGERIILSISIQVENCLCSSSVGLRRPSLKSRNRPIKWPKVLRILNILGLRIERRNGGSHVVIKKEDGATVGTLSPEGKRDTIKIKLLLSRLQEAGIPREAAVAAMDQVL